MFSNFRKTFNPTKEEQLQYLHNIKAAHNKIPETVNLIPDSHNDVLSVSEPFQSFLHDCSYCDDYVDSNCGYEEGGYCKKHRISCGWGFTCKDWKETVNFDQWYKQQIDKFNKSEER